MSYLAALYNRNILVILATVILGAGFLLIALALIMDHAGGPLSPWPSWRNRR